MLSTTVKPTVVERGRARRKMCSLQSSTSFLILQCTMSRITACPISRLPKKVVSSTRWHGMEGIPCANELLPAHWPVEEEVPDCHPCALFGPLFKGEAFLEDAPPLHELCVRLKGPFCFGCDLQVGILRE